ncbi:hypothetical protein CJJ23_01035 [Mycoplasmopsis agassizii]|uniref:Uncharacterized protein n=1 Tax=Mycoplasmopsis agassizii TaxID=33922 RepID=A0A269TJS9_9BACT|nr:hypothetical protein [Mycoplasmopsis agassizii]PAK21704.1 hypothetical protein CJJ23_01035 [Mycoplasmopsis agassizii]
MNLVNNTVEPAQVYQHKIDFVEHFQITNQTLPKEKLQVEIKRYLSDDSFSIKARMLADTSRNVVFTLQINNKTIATSQNYYTNNPRGGWLEAVFIAPKIKMKLSAINNITIIANNISNGSITGPLFISSINIGLNDYKRDYLIDSESLKIRIPYIIKFTNEALKVRSRISAQLDIEYLEIKFKKPEFERFKPIVNLLDYEIRSTANEDIFKQVDLKVGKIKQDDISDENEIRSIFVNDFQPWINKGRLEVVSQSYYDFEKHKTVNLLGANSQTGLLVPYNFKGNFILNFELQVNEAFKNLKIALNQKFDKALLNEDDGEIKLKIKHGFWNESLKSQKGIIKNSEFSKIIDNNFSLFYFETTYQRRDLDDEAE